MLSILIYKISVIILVLSILNVIKEIYSLYVAMEQEVSLNSSSKRVFLLGLSIAYIVMTIITGLSF